MNVKLTYNSEVNKILKKMGKTSNFSVEISPSNVEAATKFLELIKNNCTVRATAKRHISENCDAVRLYGVTIAKATSKKSGAFVPPSVRILTDDEPTSGGSYRYWETVIYKDTVVEFEVPKIIVEKCKFDELDWEIEILDDTKQTDLEKFF